MTKEDIEKKLQEILTQHQNTIVIATKLAGIAEFLQMQLKELEPKKEEKTTEKSK